MKKITLCLGTLLISSSILGATLVSAEEINMTYKSNGAVTFEPNTDPVNPVDPTDPDEEVDPVDPTDPEGPNPGTEGPLSIDYASSLDFGKNKNTLIVIKVNCNFTTVKLQVIGLLFYLSLFSFPTSFFLIVSKIRTFRFSSFFFLYFREFLSVPFHDILNK